MCSFSLLHFVNVPLNFFIIFSGLYQMNHSWCHLMINRFTWFNKWYNIKLKKKIIENILRGCKARLRIITWNYMHFFLQTEYTYIPVFTGIQSYYKHHIFNTLYRFVLEGCYSYQNLSYRYIFYLFYFFLFLLFCVKYVQSCTLIL